MEKLMVRRLHIETLIKIFIELYDNGVEYADLYTEAKEDPNEEDMLGIHFCKEYMNPDYVDRFEDLEEDDLSKDDIKVFLSDEDLNELL